MFRPLVAIFRRNTQLLTQNNGSVVSEVTSQNNCVIPPEDDKQGPKHVAAKFIKYKMNTLKSCCGGRFF
jgi:hypothetical protein